MSLPRPSAGFTLLEVLVVLAIFGLLFSLAGWSYLSTRNPPRDAARAVHAALFTLRSQAMSNTQARRMVLVSDKELLLQSALSCGEANPTKWTQVGSVPLDAGPRPLTLVADGPVLTGTTRLVVCFTPRGQASQAGSLRVSDPKRGYLVEVALGGGVRTSAAP